MSFADTIAAEGFAGKLMFDLMTWFGDGNVHRVSRYLSTDPTVIKNQLSLMQIAGAKGVRVTWLGPSHTFIHQAAMEVCDKCSDMGMLFALLLDPHVNGQVNWWLDPGFLMMCESAAYIPEKWLCDFGTGIDYTKVTLPAGFSVLYDQKGFGWANAYNGANAQTLSELQATNKLSTMKWPFVTNGFCDAGFPLPVGVTPLNFTGTRDYGHSVWSDTAAARAIDHQAGNFFFDCIAALSLCPTAPYVGMVWNDADEGAGVEHFMSAYAGVRIGS